MKFEVKTKNEEKYCFSLNFSELKILNLNISVPMSTLGSLRAGSLRADQGSGFFSVNTIGQS